MCLLILVKEAESGCLLVSVKEAEPVFFRLGE